ncbi:unnamed protein product [Angiostrongylus costaricensis]|uniref:Exostosin domain-containing protein n=1 Tax=Angiostrongylus costaricensis TaxID=334426 RepID=A0A0R3Q1H2_ANGCS|nr:unnamed protein product [Angiostrongylus costaricensis]
MSLAIPVFLTAPRGFRENRHTTSTTISGQKSTYEDEDFIFITDDYADQCSTAMSFAIPVFLTGPQGFREMQHTSSTTNSGQKSTYEDEDFIFITDDYAGQLSTALSLGIPVFLTGPQGLEKIGTLLLLPSHDKNGIYADEEIISITDDYADQCSTAISLAIPVLLTGPQGFREMHHAPSLTISRQK